jgi:DNA-binding response OmpR family regulator
MILLIETEIELAEVLFSVLTLGGYGVSVARNDRDAIQQIRWQVPELIIVGEWQMPGVGGIDLCRRIREHSATDSIPIIMMGGSWPGVEPNALYDLFIQKPFSVDRLLVSVNALLSSGARQTNASKAIRT